MSGVYSRRLYGHKAASDRDWTDSPTVPAGTVWVIKQISFVNQGAIGGYLIVQIMPGELQIWGINPTTPDHHVDWGGMQVLNAGENIMVLTDTPGCIMVSGYELYT